MAEPPEAALEPVVPDPTAITATSTNTGWQSATIEAVWDEAASARTFRLRLERPTGHQAGQHYVVRLTAPDGYTASRSYSVSSAPLDPSRIELTVERFVDGEVSGFLHDVAEVGDELEVRGPIGGWFVWDATTPALLVGGGSGVAPLMSMLRLARHLGRSDLVRVLVSARSPEELWFADELPGPEVRVAFTRRAAEGEERPAGRLTAADLPGTVPDGTVVFVCGSPAFCDHATGLLIERGVPAGAIRVERFGPSG